MWEEEPHLHNQNCGSAFIFDIFYLFDDIALKLFRREFDEKGICFINNLGE